MLFDSWQGLWRVLVVGVVAYAALILLLRVTGKRTLSKLNAFDLVITVALGSTLATIILSKDVALAEGVLAFAVLVLLQYAITWASVRWGWVRRAVKSEPALLFFRGECLQESMRRERITRDELLNAVRSSGEADLRAVQAVVLESDGSLTVVSNSTSATPPTALQNLRGVDPE